MGSREARIGSGEKRQPHELRGKALVKVLVAEAKLRFNGNLFTTKNYTDESGRITAYTLGHACRDTISADNFSFDTVFETLTDDKSTSVKPQQLPSTYRGVYQFEGTTFREAKMALAAEVLEAEIVAKNPGYRKRAEKRLDTSNDIDPLIEDTTGW